MNQEDYTKEIENILNTALRNTEVEFLREEVEKFLIKLEKPAPERCIELASLISLHAIRVINQESL